MEDIHRKLLQTELPYLTQNMDLKNTSLLQHLLAKNVLSANHYEILETKAVNRERVSYFVVHILPKRGPDAFSNFMECLRDTEHDFIADHLEEALPSSRRTALSDEEIVEILNNDKWKVTDPVPVKKADAEKLLKQNDAYKLTSKQRGRAVIINNKYFLDCQRDGAEHDLVALKKLFVDLSFVVSEHNNQSSEGIRKIIEDEANNNHQQYDAFLLFIMSHGVNGSVLGTDTQNVSINYIVSRIGECVTLQNKPKIFLFQACRNVPGQKGQPGGDGDQSCSDTFELKDSGLENLDDASSDLGDATPNDPGASSSPKLIVNHSDIFIGYSTVRGMFSYRRPDIGSYFVRYFVYICSMHAHEQDIHGIMNKVNRLLLIKVGAKQQQQVGENVERGLTKKIFFFPGYHL